MPCHASPGHFLAAIALVLATSTAQCPYSALQITPIGSACSGRPPLYVALGTNPCNLYVSYVPWTAQWLPYRTWLVLADSPQLSLYPQLAGACPQLQSPLAIAPLVGFPMVLPIPPGLPPATIYFGAVTLYHEPNTNTWVLAPAQQTLQLSLH